MLGLVAEALGKMADKKKLKIYQEGEKLDNVEFFSEDVALPVLFAHAMNKARSIGMDHKKLMDWPVDLHVSSVGFFNVVAEADEAIISSVTSMEMCLYGWDSCEEILFFVAEAGRLSRTPDGVYVIETPYFYQAAKVLNGENFNVSSWPNKKQALNLQSEAKSPFMV